MDVPYVSQGDDDVGCVPACVKMIVEYYSGKYPDLPNPDIDAIKKAMDYDDDGTPLDGIIGVNDILRGTDHQLEFNWGEFASFSDIQKELENERPVIVWIKSNRTLPISHSVVIKETTDDDLVVKVNDPESQVDDHYETSEFMKVWENSDRILIRASVVERPKQRQMGDFV